MDTYGVLIRKNGLWEVKYHSLTHKDAEYMTKVLGMQGYITKISPAVEDDLDAELGQMTQAAVAEQTERDAYWGGIGFDAA